MTCEEALPLEIAVRFRSFGRSDQRFGIVEANVPYHSLAGLASQKEVLDTCPKGDRPADDFRAVSQGHCVTLAIRLGAAAGRQIDRGLYLPAAD